MGSYTYVSTCLLGGILKVAPFYGWDPKGFYLAPGGILKVAPFSGWDPKGTGSYLAPGGILKGNYVPVFWVGS